MTIEDVDIKTILLQSKLSLHILERNKAQVTTNIKIPSGFTVHPKILTADGKELPDNIEQTWSFAPADQEKSYDKKILLFILKLALYIT